MDQSILDRLTELFPTARVSWIYASSEAGATIAVHDGRAGFPVAWLGRESAPGRPRLSVDDGELLIASPKRGEGIDRVLRTGDRVEVVDGRVLITGRIASDEINVGGAKASAAAVRDVLQAHPASPGPRSAAARRRSSAASSTADVVLSGQASRTATDAHPLVRRRASPTTPCPGGSASWTRSRSRRR